MAGIKNLSCEPTHSFRLDIRRENNILFNLTTNVIYGIRQNYLIRSCLEGTPESAFYDRHYQSFRTNENNPNRYTIFYSTGMLVLIFFEFMTDMLEHALLIVFVFWLKILMLIFVGAPSLTESQISSAPSYDPEGALVNIPSQLVSRAVSFVFQLDGTNVGSITEADLDSSTSYNVRNLNRSGMLVTMQCFNIIFIQVSLSGLNVGVENNVTVAITTRQNVDGNSINSDTIIGVFTGNVMVVVIS